MKPIVVAALYEFAPLDDLERHRSVLLAALSEHGVRGTLLLAREGINGTIAGSAEGIEAVLSVIRGMPGCADVDVKFSSAEAQPFLRAKVRIKNEIVTMGVPSVDPNAQVGRYVDPRQWNEVISDPDTLVIDTRNDYEVAIGTFRGAIDPKTETFRDFPAWFDRFREENPGKRIAMFCTGGIRCEKATSYVLSKGFNDVVHLKGGILKYLETVAEDESLWEGECFVFDGRVSVGHGLSEGSHDLCHACRRPINAAMKASPDYTPGVSCPQCIDDYTEEDRARFAERHKQMELAAQRGEVHLGKAE